MSALEPITPTTPRPLARALLAQRWRDVAFLHWPCDPALVAPLLPPGVTPDVIDGVTWVGLIGFRMEGAGLGPVAVPYFGTFPEINVRLYSTDARGRRGVVFRSLETSRLAAALAARAGFALPYCWARMRIARNARELRYTSDRLALGPRPGRTRFTVRIGERIPEPSELEHWLTARWGLHTAIRGRTAYVPNEHPPWQLHRAAATEVRDELIPRAGLPRPAVAPTSVLFSPGVPVRFGAPEYLD